MGYGRYPDGHDVTPPHNYDWNMLTTQDDDSLDYPLMEV